MPYHLGADALAFAMVQDLNSGLAALRASRDHWQQRTQQEKETTDAVTVRRDELWATCEADRATIEDQHARIRELEESVRKHLDLIEDRHARIRELQAKLSHEREVHAAEVTQLRAMAHPVGRIEKTARLEAEIAALREAVALLGAECRLQREFRSRLTEYKLDYLNLKGERTMEMERRLIGGYGPTKQRTDANPIAAAAVRGTDTP